MGASMVILEESAGGSSVVLDDSIWGGERKPKSDWGGA